MEITSKLFGTTSDGREVHLYRMQNKTGSYVELLDWGAHIRAIGMPDRDGNIVDVCLGFDDMAGYEKYAGTYMGATVGRRRNTPSTSTRCPSHSTCSTALPPWMVQIPGLSK